YDKLVEEKTTKGYVEVGGDDSDGSGGGVLKEMMFSTTKNTADIGELNTFIGKRISEFKSAKSIKKGNKHVYKICVDYDDDEDTFNKRLTEFLATDAAPTAQGFVIGSWTPEPDASSETIIAELVKKKDRLSELTALFVGEIGQEECEMSWIQQSDMGPLFAAFPKLELLRTRGSEGLAFNKVKHDTLRALGVESGGLPKKVVAQICKAKLPKLEYLELWLGTDEYGGDCAVNDLQPILSGKAFPNLKYLGLRNSEIADDIAGVVVNSPIAKQVETLDLSLGTLTDEGGNALLSLPTDGNLKRLDVHFHYMSKAVVKKLKALPFTVNTADVQDVEDWGDGEMRFVAVGE
ncbi:MAG: STM4015 family protein, partial [Pirellulaceae bacterium]|nr:STM4015 family protein [Pirellulaceae bacterium]